MFSSIAPESSNWPAGSSLTNRVVITNFVTVMAVSANPADTIIRGAADYNRHGLNMGVVFKVYIEL